MKQNTSRIMYYCFIKKGETRHLNQFIVHAALDAVDEIMWGTQSMYLKVIDKFNEWYVSSYVLASGLEIDLGLRMMLLHDAQNTDGIKHFFQEVHELYIKMLMNPFLTPSSVLNHAGFDQRVKVLARKWL